MLNEAWPLLNLPFMLLMLPLIMSVACILNPSRKFNFFVTMGTLTAEILLLLYLIVQTSYTGTMLFSVGNSNVSILSEYRITVFNLFFLLSIFLVKIITFVYFDYEIPERTSKNHMALFFSTYLINCFALVGMLISGNIFNIFIYMEIYSFTTNTLFADYRDDFSSELSFRYFRNSVLGSILLMLFTVLLYVNFRTPDIDLIRQQIAALPRESLMGVGVLSMTLFFGLFMKFFTMRIYMFQIRRSVDVVNLLFITLGFVDIIIGVSLFIRFIYSVLGIDLIFNVVHMDAVLQIIGTVIIGFYGLRIARTRNLFQVVMSMCMMTIGYVLLCLGNNNLMGSVAIMFFILHHISANLFFYLCTTFLIYVSGNSDIVMMNALRRHKIPVIAAAASKFILPVGGGLMSYWFFVRSSFQAGNMFILPIIIFEKVCLFFFAWRVYIVMFKKDYRLDEDDIYSKTDPIVNTYVALFYVMLGLMAVVTIATPLIAKVLSAVTI